MENDKGWLHPGNHSRSRYSLWRKNAFGGAGEPHTTLLHARKVYGNSIRLQDDSTRAHGAAAVREFLDAEGVQQMPGPACFPIRHAWDALDPALNEKNNILQILQEVACPLMASISLWTVCHDVLMHWSVSGVAILNISDWVTFEGVILNIVMHKIPLNMCFVFPVKLTKVDKLKSP